MTTPRLRLGLNISFAAKRWPAPEGWLTSVMASGLDRVQFSLDLLDPAWPAPVRRRLARQAAVAARRQGVAIDSCFTGLAAYSQSLLGHPDGEVRAAALAWHKRAVEISVLLGATGYGGFMGAGSETTGASALDTVIPAVLDLADAAAVSGLGYLLWEPMPVASEIPHTIAETRRVMAEIRAAAVPVWLCLDLGHMCAPDGNGPDRRPEAWIEELAPFVRCIHLQQTDGRGDRHWPFWDDGQAVTGIIEPKRIMALARQLPLDDVDLVLEPVYPYERAGTAVLDSLRGSARLWRDLF